MSESLALSLVAKGATSYLKAFLDPGMRRRLDEEITAHVLSEIPRVVQLLEQRIADVIASGCTPMEANIIAHQVVEAQKRTLDDEKRRRLSNVLVNGLCTSKWDKVKHRLLIRLTSELEEEHIEVLRREARTPEEKLRDMQADRHDANVWPTPVEVEEQRAISRALDRELIARGLLDEVTKPKVKLQQRESSSDRPAVENVELETRVTISQLGRDLLAHLRDPPT